MESLADKHRRLLRLSQDLAAKRSGGFPGEQYIAPMCELRDELVQQCLKLHDDDSDDTWKGIVKLSNSVYNQYALHGDPETLKIKRDEYYANIKKLTKALANLATEIRELEETQRGEKRKR